CWLRSFDGNQGPHERQASPRVPARRARRATFPATPARWPGRDWPTAGGSGSGVRSTQPCPGTAVVGPGASARGSHPPAWRLAAPPLLALRNPLSSPAVCPTSAPLAWGRFLGAVCLRDDVDGVCVVNLGTLVVQTVTKLDLPLGVAASNDHDLWHAQQLGVLELHTRRDLRATIEEHLPARLRQRLDKLACSLTRCLVLVGDDHVDIVWGD